MSRASRCWVKLSYALSRRLVRSNAGTEFLAGKSGLTCYSVEAVVTSAFGGERPVKEGRRRGDFLQNPVPVTLFRLSLANKLDNTFTCHMGYSTPSQFECFYVQMVENIKAWTAGKPIRKLRDYIPGKTHFDGFWVDEGRGRSRCDRYLGNYDRHA